MGFDSRLTLLTVIIICYSLVVRAAPKCVETCSVGQKCSGTQCLPCPSRTYQTDPIHMFESCIPWTVKPPGSHYILIKNGTSESDAVWRCEDGYEEKQYSVEAYECVVKVATSSSTTGSSTQFLTTNSTHTTIPTIALLQPQQKKEGLSGGDIAGIVVGIVVLGIVIYFACRKRICKLKWNNANGVTVPTVDSEQPNSPTESEPMTSNHTESEVMTPDFTESKLLTSSPHNINYKFGLKLVDELGVVKFKRFLNVLCDPSGEFHAENVLQIESSIVSDVTTYLVNTFLKWVKSNGGIYKSLIATALEDVGGTGVLEYIEKSVPVIYIDPDPFLQNTDIACGAPSTGNETTSSAKRRVLRQDKFRLFYYLTDQVELVVLIKFVRELPASSERFNAYNYYRGKLLEERDSSLAFAQTLEEWWLWNPNLELKDIITDFLNDQRRQDLLENGELKSRLENIVRHDTSRVDSLGQDFCPSSENLVSDNADADQVTFNSEPESMLNDPEVSIEDISDNTEDDHVSNNIENDCTDQASANTELKSMLNDTEISSEHISDNTEDDLVSNNIENDCTDQASVNTELKSLLNDTEMSREHISNNTSCPDAVRHSKSRRKKKTEDDHASKPPKKTACQKVLMAVVH